MMVVVVEDLSAENLKTLVTKLEASEIKQAIHAKGVVVKWSTVENDRRNARVILELLHARGDG